MKGFRQFVEVGSPLYNQLMVLRPQMAQAAQKIYDEWEQVDACDVGGICDEIAHELSHICAANIGCDIAEGGHDGDDHAWVVAHNDQEAYGVDISPHLYETGGGYCWKKIPGIHFKPTDVEIWNLGLNPQDIKHLS